MSYPVIEVAENEGREEALKKCGMQIGQYVRIKNLLISPAGRNKYCVIPIVETPQRTDVNAQD